MISLLFSMCLVYTCFIFFGLCGWWKNDFVNKKLFFKFVCLTKSLVCLAIGELDNIWYFFLYIIWICLWIIFLGHCATVGLIFFVLHVKYDEFNIHVIIFFLLPSVSEGNSINLVLFFFLPGMFGNMRFVSFTFHPKSSLSFSSLFILVPDLCRYMLVLIATKEHSRSIALSMFCWLHWIWGGARI